MTNINQLNKTKKLARAYAAAALGLTPDYDAFAKLHGDLTKSAKKVYTVGLNRVWFAALDLLIKGNNFYASYGKDADLVKWIELSLATIEALELDEFEAR